MLLWAKGNKQHYNEKSKNLTSIFKAFLVKYFLLVVVDVGICRMDVTNHHVCIPFMFAWCPGGVLDSPWPNSLSNFVMVNWVQTHITKQNEAEEEEEL